MIRPATEADHEKIALHILADHHDTGFGEISAQKVRDAVSEVQNEGLILVLDWDGIAVGSIGLIVRTFWYNTTEYLTDRWFWIHPEHRKVGAALKMLREAQDFAKAAELEFFPVLTPKPELRGKLARFMSIAGFAPIGFWFKEIR